MLQDRTILQNKDWESCYVGIPYKYSGRGRDGLDCWGLVRLVHKDQFGIDLPSFTEVDTKDKQSEVISIAKEYWTPVAVEQAGDVVVFNVLGESTHVGIITKPGYFLHAYENQDVRVERLDSIKWKKRIEGIYRYSKDTGANLVGLSHPLRTKRIDAVVQAGKTLAEIHQELKEKEASELPSTAVIYVDSKLIPQSEWDTYVVQNAQRIEYRAVMQGGGGGFLKIAALIALAVAAPYAAVAIGGATGIAMGTVGALTAIGYATTIGINIAGAMLLNSIFPTRPPKANTYSNETGKASWFLQGGSNQSNKYGAIPVVLGRMRYTPPTAIETYYEAQDTTSYLRTVLCWGYGPLAISDIRIGDESLDNYYNVEIETLNGYSTDNRTRFDTLYGKDVEQQQVGVALNNNKAVVDTAVRTSNVVTVNTKTSEQPHGFLIGQHVDLYDNSTLKVSGEILTVSEYSFTFSNTGTNGSINCTTAVATSWVVRTLDEEVDELTLSFEYPQGLYKTDAGSGQKSSLSSSLSVAYRQIGSSNWLNANTTISAFTTNLRPVPDLYAEGLGHTAPVQMYQWVYLLIDKDGNVFTRVGSASSNYNTTISTEVRYLSKSTYALSTSYNVKPNVYPEDIVLAKILVSRDFVVSTQEVYSGFIINNSGLLVSVNGGSISRANGEVFLTKKALSPFVNTVKYNVPRGKYEVRVRNTKYNSGDYNADSVTFGALTGYRNTKPIAFDKPLAMSAIRIRATNQINGNVDGFTGTVQSICKDYDYTTDTWVDRATSNPASLFRYVLQHPANSKALADSAIDLVTLKDWHNTCRLNGFTYNSVLTEQQSLTEVLKDIAAAGRASPSRIDGKYTVIQDKPRTTITQHFTPHNSWGFEGSKSLPKLPHAFRVTFINEEKGFQPDEYIVHNDGYNANNASLFEGMSLPGVTEPALVYKHARFHLAQIKLRPETYTINADLEHLVCNRGDLVKVVHDVPMFGIASCRVGNKLSSTQLQLDEDIPMQAGKQYTVRIRNDDGSSIVRTVQSKLSDGYYNLIDLTTPLGVNEGLANNLILFGEINQESVDLIVLGIETNADLTARLTLVDYSPEVYDSDIETIPEFNSKVTLPAGLNINTIQATPQNVTALTDESAMTVTSGGGVDYGVRISWNNPSNLPKNVTSVEVQLDWFGDNTIDWLESKVVNLTDKTVLFDGRTKGDTYVYRLRYVDSTGRTSSWTNEYSTVVTGRTRPPADVLGARVSPSFGGLSIYWNNSPENDIVAYEIRTVDSGWGSSGGIYYGRNTSAIVTPSQGNNDYYIKAITADGVYSANASKVSFNYSNIQNPTALTYSWHDSSTTTASIILDWDDVETTFGTKGYEISYDNTSKFVSASTLTLPANWLSTKTFTVKTVDNLGLKSSGISISVLKQKPNPPTNVRAQVIDNTVMLFWTNAVKTTLPIVSVKIRKGEIYLSSTEIGSKSGAFTTIDELQGGKFTYWLSSVDSDGQESDPVSVAASVSEPPDFVFKGSFVSSFTGTLINAVVSQGSLILPVNTTETQQQHFDNNSWVTPQEQVNAGFPIFIQPAFLNGYYTETFDFGTVIGSSKITIDYQGNAVSGNPSLVCDIEVSSDGNTWTWYPGTLETYAVNFRYVRAMINVSGNNTSLYSLNYLSIRCDAKQKTDSFTLTSNLSDTNGTVFNFNKEFIDVESISLTPLSTSPVIAVYDFKDSVLSGTYTIISNLCTVTCNSHGLTAGQNIRLNFTSGGVTSRQVTVISSTTNTFTCSVNSTNTSGNVSMYWQGFKAYAFDHNGNRVTCSLATTVRGY